MPWLTPILLFMCTHASLQEDTFIATMSSAETLTFYAGVTLGSNWTRATWAQRVDEVLAAVGLKHAAHTLVSINHWLQP